MRKWIIIGVVLLTLGATVIVALLNLNSLLRRNKDYLLDQAQQALGRKLSVGDVEVTLWGGLGVKLKSFKMSDDPSFSSGDFVRAQDLQVNLKLLPLLRKEFEVKRLILHGPVIEIVRDRQGRFNFSTIGKSEKEKREKEKVKKPAEAEKKMPPSLLVSLVDISGGEVHYLDRQKGADIRAKQIDFKVKDLDWNRPFTAELATALFAEKQNLKLQARIGPLGSKEDLSDVPFDGKANIDSLDFDKLTAALPPIKAALPKDLGLSGIVKLKDLQLKGTLKDLALKGSLDGTGAAVNFGNTLRKVAGIPLVLSTDARYANRVVRLRQTKVQLNNMESTVKGDVMVGDAPAVNLALDSNRFSLEGWDKIIPAIHGYDLSGNIEAHTSIRGKLGQGSAPQIQGTLTLAGVSAKPPRFPQPIKNLDTTINFTGQRAEFKDMTLSLGSSNIRLAAQVDRFAPLTFSYKLSTPELRPADFQAGLAADRTADVIRNLTSEGTLRTKEGALTFQGNLASAQGTLYKINYTNLGTNLALENNIAHIRNFRVNAVSGSLQAEGEYAYNQPAPRFSLTSKVQGIDLAELHRSLEIKTSRDIQGRLNADMKISGNGKQWEEIKPSLRGQGQAEVIEGALLNFNIAESVLTSITGIPGLTSVINPQVRQKYPETFQAKDTKFKELKGLFNLADSRINVKDLQIAAADYRVQGNGWVDFEKRVDFQARLMLSQMLSADLARSVRELAYAFNSQNQFEVPFTLTGTLPNVRPRPDSSYVGKMIERGFVRRGTEELQRRFFGKKETAPPAEQAPQAVPSPERTDKKKSRTEDLIRKGLEGLFNR